MGRSIGNLAAVTRVGLDLAKKVFQVHAVDAKGEIVVARKLTRGRLVAFFAGLPSCVVAMEACSSAHHWGRALLGLGHEVRLIPAAHVKPYVRRNKNDAADAAAICEAAMRPGQRFVPVRSIENQAELMRHRTRELLAGQRTSLLNALRGHMAEIGVVADAGRAARLRPEATSRRRLRRQRRDRGPRLRARSASSAHRSDRRARRGDRSDRHGDRSVGQGRRDCQAVDDHPRRRPGHRLGDHSHDPRQREADAEPSEGSGRGKYASLGPNLFRQLRESRSRRSACSASALVIFKPSALSPSRRRQASMARPGASSSCNRSRQFRGTAAPRSRLARSRRTGK